MKGLCKLVTRKNKDHNFLTRYLHKESVFKQIVLRFYLESCLEFSICALISVIMIDGETFDDPWEAFSTVSAMISIVGLIAGPFYYIRLQGTLIKDMDLSDIRDVKQHKNGVLFYEFRLGRPSTSYPIVFVLRRYVMITLLMTMPNHSLTQI